MRSKKVLFSIVFFIVAFSSGFSQKQTLFVDKDFGAVMQQAKAEKKPFVLMFYATWCVHCNKMKNEVFTLPEVINTYNQNFICTAVNIENKEGTTLREKFKNQFLVKSYPTFVFFDHDGNVTNCLTGELKADEFIKEGIANLNPANHLQSIKSKFESNPADHDNTFAYILMTKRLGFNPTEITQKHLKTLSPENYYTEKNWRLFSNGITDFSAPEFADMIKNRTLFEKEVSATRIEKKIAYVINESFKGYADKQDTANYRKNRIIAENLHFRKIDSLLFRQDLNLYENMSDWKSYNKALEKNMAQFGLKDASFIHAVAAVYQQFIDDKKMLGNAVSWQKEAIKLNPSLDKYVLISNLLLKMKDYKQGLEYANKGKELATALGFNTGEIDGIIGQLKSKMKT